MEESELRREDTTDGLVLSDAVVEEDVDAGLEESESVWAEDF